jgi:transcriptional regulator with XRE-family HTH domain
MSSFPSLLKTWRGRRRYSQLALALAANVSPRHLAFLETGRASPSPSMIERLSNALELPLPARNQLLHEAGFAARYPARAWTDAALAPLRAAVERMLERHAPYPGLDRPWVASIRCVDGGSKF